MKELVILVGNIGSGKSTICKKYQEKGYVVIARDMLRYAIGGGKYIFNTKYEPIIFSIEKEMLEKFMELEVPIIIDEVGISKVLRAEYVFLAQEYDYKVICHIMKKLSKEESVERRMKNPHGQYDKKLWESVWERFDKMYEEPSKEEGIDKIIREK